MSKKQKKKFETVQYDNLKIKRMQIERCNGWNLCFHPVSILIIPAVATGWINEAEKNPFILKSAYNTVFSLRKERNESFSISFNKEKGELPISKDFSL